MSANHEWDESGGFSTNGELSMNVKPLQMLSISTGPSLQHSKDLAQYLRTEDDATAVATASGRLSRPSRSVAALFRALGRRVSPEDDVLDRAVA